MALDIKLPTADSAQNPETRKFALTEAQTQLQSVTTGLAAKPVGVPGSVDPTDLDIFGRSAAEQSVFTSLGDAVESSGLISETAIKGIEDQFKDRGTFDPDLNIDETMKLPENSELSTFLKKTFSRNDESDRRFHQDLLDTANKDDLLDRISTYREDRRRNESADAHGAGIRFLGDAIGFSRDIVATAPIAIGGVAGARAATGIANSLLDLGVVSTVEAAAAGAERLIRAQRDFTINGNQEALQAAVLTFGLTAAVGGAVQAVARRGVSVESIVERSQSDVGSVTTRSAPDAAGAQASPANASIETPTLTTDGKPFIAGVVPKVLRSLKGIVSQRRADATEVFMKTGDDRELRSTTILDHLIGGESDRVTKEGITVARPRNVDDADSEAIRISRQYQSSLHSEHTAFVREAFNGARSPIPVGEFDQMVIMVIHSRNAGIADPMEVINRLSPKAAALEPNQQKILADHITVAADQFKRITDTQGKEAVRHGMLQADQIIENYAPIKPRRGNQDLDKYTEYFHDMLHRPTDENINEIWPGRLEEGETFESILKTDRARADRIRDDLEASRLQKRTETTYVRVDTKEKALDSFISKTKARMEATWSKRISTIEKALKKTKDIKQVGKLSDELASLKARMKKIKDATDAETRSLIGRHGSNAERRQSKKLYTELRRAIKADKKAMNQMPRYEQARAIALKVMRGSNPGDFVPDRLTVNTGILKDRILDHDPLDERFSDLFETRSSILMDSYIRQSNSRLRLHEIFGKNKAAKEDIAATPVRMLHELAEGADPATAKRILGDADIAEQSIKASLGLDRIPTSEAARLADFWSRQVAKVNIASMLKTLGITQITDVALAFGRGRSFGTGPMGVLTAPKTGRLARAVRAADQPELEAIIDGMEVMGIRNDWKDLFATDGRTAKLYGIDGDELAARSELENIIDNSTDKITAAAGWLSFSTPMNLLARRGMGADTAKHMLNDWTNFKSLSRDIQSAWERNGIDEFVAADIAAFLNRSDGIVEIGGIKFPNLKKLMEIDPELGSRATTAANRLAGEVIPSPGTFDKPLLSRTPLGRLYLQFSSFSYTVGVRVLPELRRAFRNDPLGYRMASLTLGGMLAASATLYLRAVLSGDQRLEDMERDLATAEGRIQFTQRAALLLPFLPGQSAHLAEIFTLKFGPHFNEMVGANVMMQDPARFMRFRGEDPLVKLLGPTASQASRFIKGAGLLTDATLEGDKEKAQKAAKIFYRMAPIIDNFPLKAVARGVKTVYGDE